MDYANDTVRAAKPAQNPQAKAAAPKRRAVPAIAKAKEGHRRGAVGFPAIRPALPAAYGFLKTRFLPHFTGQLPAGNEAEKAAFYTSLGELCSHYGICPADTQALAYPYGRSVALHEAQRLVQDNYPQHIAIALEEDARGVPVLNATESYNTQNTLYYIPVIPLHYLLQDRSRKKAAQLLLCTFAYLYHSVGVPYYRDEESYLYWNYDMVSQWVLDDPDGWETDNYNGYVSEINAASHIGEVMLRRLWNPILLNNFEKWASGFVPTDSFGKDCLTIVKKALRLWQDYPEAHLYRHADPDCLPDPEEGYDDNDCITMEKYIGFVADTKGWLYDSLEQGINSEFGECSSIQEPVLKRFFDGRMQDDESLDFECRLFPLINDLCYILNNAYYDT
jgi:hypothetical protein